MSVRVNLLPHREERRKAQRKHLGILSGMVAALAIAVVVLIHGVIAGYISNQGDRNAFLKKENVALDKQIEEIKKLRDEIAALLARKQVIERLQSDRAQVVNLLDQLARQMPDGVYLKTMRQQGPKVFLSGYSQSNARISTLMRNVASSPHLENPVLVEIKVANIGGKRVSEFTLNLNLRAAQTGDAKAGAAKAGAAKAGAAKKG